MMQLIRILGSNPIFFIRPDVGMEMMEAALQMVAREAEFSAPRLGVYENYEHQPGANRDPWQEASAGGQRIAVYSVSGTLTGEDAFCGPKGYSGMSADFRRMRENASISGILLRLNSPGGQVNGLEPFAMEIAETAAVKPVLAYVEGQAASAAYWLASRATEIIVGGRTSEVGSIGTLIAGFDLSEYWKRSGVRSFRVVSSLSPDKARYRLGADMTEEEIAEIQRDLLDPLTREFQAAVRATRPGVKDAAMTGHMYMGRDAVRQGLADSVGSYSQALARLGTLIRRASSTAARQASTHNTPTNMSNFFTRLFPGRAAVDLSETDVQAAIEEAVTAQRTDYEAQLQTLRDQLTQAEGATTAAQARITELTAEVATLRTQVTTLSAAPVNRIADARGDAGVPTADEANRHVVVNAPAWAGLGQDDLAERLTKLGLKD